MFLGAVCHQTYNQTLLFLYFFGHYFNRSFIYPYSLAPGSNPLHLSTMALGAIYTGLNGYIQGYYFYPTFQIFIDYEFMI